MWGYFTERDLLFRGSQLNPTDGYVLQIFVERFARLMERYEFA